MEQDEAASGEAVLRECVGRPVSISVSQFPHNALVGNPNRSLSEFDSCLPDLVLQSMPELHTMNTGWTQASHGSFRKIIGHSHFHNSEPHYSLRALHTLLKYLACKRHRRANPP